MSTYKDIIETINTIQPFYEKLNSKYSKSYLSGSYWYVGDDLLNWWKKESIKNYQKNMKILLDILNILILNKKNELSLIKTNEIEIYSQ